MCPGHLELKSWSQFGRCFGQCYLLFPLELNAHPIIRALQAHVLLAVGVGDVLGVACSRAGHVEVVLKSRISRALDVDCKWEWGKIGRVP